MDEAVFSSLYLDDRDSDVTLVFENEEPGSSLSIPVHSLVLKLASDVFKTMLERDTFKESHTKVIEIQIMGDISVGLHFVKYLYTKTLPDLEKDMYSIMMKMSHMYNVSSLLQVCESRIMALLDISSVCRIYQSLEAVSSQEFRDHCLKYIQKFAFAIFMDCHHVCLLESTMKLLLESDFLNVVDENQVLNAVWHWARTRCIQKNLSGNMSAQLVASNLLGYVRWCSIKKDDTDCPWIKLLEKQREMMYTTSQKRNKFLPSFSVKENANQLKLRAGYGNSLSDFKREGKYQMLMFSTNKDILLTGISFVVCFRHRYSWENSLTVSLNDTDINCETNKEVRKNIYMVEHPAHQNVFSYSVSVELAKPTLICASLINTISLLVSTKTGSVAFPQFSWKNFPQNQVWNTSQSVQFSIQGNVSSIKKLFYYLKK